MTKSVKVNFAYNLLNTTAGLLFPIITFPYISRVVMAEGIGKVNFLYSIINYIALFTAIGIPIYGIREIAKVRHDIKKRNRATIEILLLHIGLTFIGYVIVFILAFSVNKIHDDCLLFLLLSLHLLLSAIGVLWFYQAIEEFKFIAIRSLIIRFLVLVSLFVFVKSKDDLYAYAAIMILSEVGNNLINFFYLRNFIKITKEDWRSLDIKRHIRPSLKIFVLNLITSIYVNLDSVMLGFLGTNSAVGFYTASVKIAKALLGIVTTLGTVLLPRLSNYIAIGEIENFNVLSRKAVNIVLTISIPMAIGLIFISPQLVIVFCGESFNSSVLTLQLISPIIVFIGLSNLTGIQVLYSQGLEKIVIQSTLVGAIVNCILNLILIPHFLQNGAAIATCIAEFSVTSTMLIIGRRYIPYCIFNQNTLKIILFSIIMCLPILYIRTFSISVYWLLLIEILISIFIYVAFLVFTKNELAIIFYTIIKNKIKK